VAEVLFQNERQNAQSIFESMYAGKTPEPFSVQAGQEARHHRESESPITPHANVVAVFEGSESGSQDEYVALGAHYDHVGIGLPVNGDAILQRRDDDGSGQRHCSALLGFGEGPRTNPNALFCLSGMPAKRKDCGARATSPAYPTLPLAKIVTQINIDMIGSQ